MAAGSRLLVVLPMAAAACWAGALAWSGLRINPWGPFGDGFAFYGLAAPAWLPWTLAAAGLAGLGASIWRRALPLPYAAVAPVAVLAGGAKQLASNALVDLLVFAVLCLAALEFLTVRARFEGVVASAQNLGPDEQPPLLGFLLRYTGSLTVACAALAAGLWALVVLVAPAIASLFSERLADGVELESAVGITLFVAIPILAAVAVRVLVDGLRASRAPAAPAVQSDIQDLRPITREGAT